MADARDLLCTLAAEDRRGAVFCAALCAASVAHLVPVGERRPWRAVRLALAWGMGVQVPRERLRRASIAASNAAAVANEDAIDYATNIHAASASAASADAADAAADAASADADSWSNANHPAHLHALSLHQTTPIAPTLADIRRAAPSAQVAWDRLVERCPEPVRIGTLGDALARARTAHLYWTCPVERALAERCEGAELIEIWTGRRG